MIESDTEVVYGRLNLNVHLVWSSCVNVVFSCALIANEM